MKKRNVQIAAIAMAGLMLTGCGDAAYYLTDKEESIIVNYAAHMVAKYNTYQKEGLAYVDLDDEDTEDTDSETSETADDTAADESTSGGNGTGAPADSTDAENAVSLDEIFGQDGLSLSYVGARLETSYVEDSYYALQADPGYTYLVVGIDITNNSDVDVDVDYLTRQPEFAATVNGEAKSRAETTILMQDFSTYQGTLKAGDTVETVLLFQVPDSVESVDDLVLEVSVDGNNYQINL